jgi:hypothetical protein
MAGAVPGVAVRPAAPAPVPVKTWHDNAGHIYVEFYIDIIIIVAPLVLGLGGRRQAKQQRCQCSCR